MFQTLRPAMAGFALLTALALPASSVRLDGQAPTGIVAIRNATLITVTKGTIPAGTIVLQNGKITAIGATVNIPAGAEIIDGTGKFVSPGIIDAHSHIANDDINEGGTSVSSMTG
ncbi:MAG: amidohydrolase, partial [Acidobacteria bacterium]|nr:amidohydrolase [Acidobacteriota bacterium]